MTDDNGNTVVDFGAPFGVVNFGGGVDPKTGRTRRRTVAQKWVDPGLKRVVWLWANGTRTEVRLETFAEDLQLAFALHGVSQKLGDSYASAEGLEEAQEAFDQLLDQLLGGSWEKPRAEGKETGGMLARACAEAFECSIEKATAVVKGLNSKEKTAMELDPKVAPILARMRAERVKGEVKKDFGALFV